jgi:MFS family permease
VSRNKDFSPDRAAVKAVLLAGATLTVMAGATIAPVLPVLRERFADMSGVDLWVRLVLTLPALAIALSAPPMGLLVDRVGRLPVFVGSLLLYALAGASGYVTDSLLSLLAGRALLGVGVAGVMTAGSTLIADYYSGEKRSRILGLQGAFMGLGGVIFLLAGGLLADAGWRNPFLVYVLGLTVIPGALVFLREPVRAASTPSRSDPETKPWGILLLIYGLAFMGQVVFYVVPVQTPFLLGAIAHTPPSISGFAIAGGAFMSALAAWQYFRIQARLGYRSIAAASFLFMAGGYLVVSAAEGVGGVLVGLMVAGAGIGLIMPNSIAWLTASIAPSLRGRAIGALTAAVFLGQFVSPLLVQPLVTRLGPGAAFLGAGLLSLLLAAAMRLPLACFPAPGQTTSPIRLDSTADSPGYSVH